VGEMDDSPCDGGVHCFMYVKASAPSQ